MTTISGVSSASSAWPNMNATRGSRPPGGMNIDKMLAKVDTDGSGGIDKSELQGMLDKVAQKTGVSNSADELFSKMDSDGDGSLSKAELGQGMKDLMPPPPSTVDFAQSRSEGSDGADDLFAKVDTDGDGSVSQAEMKSLMEIMDKMAASEGTDTASASSDMFSKLDTDGDGSLSQAEFAAGRPQGGPPGASGAPMPPPPPPGNTGGSAAAGASSTRYDPLDTNQDGVVSMQERMAGTNSSDSVQSLFKSIDTDGDNTISNSESDSFIKQLTAELESMSSSTEAADSASSSKDSSDGERFDLARLARMAYDQIANGWSQHAKGSTVSVTA